MTNSQIFKAAHARAAARKASHGGTYAQWFAISLRNIWSEEKSRRRVARFMARLPEPSPEVAKLERIVTSIECAERLDTRQRAELEHYRRKLAELKRAA